MYGQNCNNPLRLKFVIDMCLYCALHEHETSNINNHVKVDNTVPDNMYMYLDVCERCGRCGGLVVWSAVEAYGSMWT